MSRTAHRNNMPHNLGSFTRQEFYRTDFGDLPETITIRVDQDDAWQIRKVTDADDLVGLERMSRAVFAKRPVTDIGGRFVITLGRAAYWIGEEL